MSKGRWIVSEGNSYFYDIKSDSFKRVVADPQPKVETPGDVIRDAIERARKMNDYVSMGDLAVKLASYPVNA